MPRQLLNPRQKAHIEEVSRLIEEQDMSTEWTVMFRHGETPFMATSKNRGIKPSEHPTFDDLGLYTDLGLVEVLNRNGNQMSFRYRQIPIQELVERSFFKQSDNSIPHYPLNEHQQLYLTKLAGQFEVGLTHIWTVWVAGDGTVNTLPTGDSNIVPNSLTLADIHAFADAQLLELRTRDNGEITYFRFRKEQVIDAVQRGFELHPMFRNGGTNMHISIGGDNYGGNFGLESRFENITQTINAGIGTPDNMKANLEDLFRDLGNALSKVPDTYSEEKADVELAAEDISKELEVENPNKKRLEIRANRLKAAAEKVRDIAPPVIETAVKIISALSPLIHV